MVSLETGQEGDEAAGRQGLVYVGEWSGVEVSKCRL